MQVVGVENLFALLEKTFPIVNVIEVGTAHGGLANILACVFADTEIHTFDNISWEPGIYKENIRVHIADCWDPDFIGKYQSLQKPGMTMFVIDGGDKAKEINILSQYAEPGDLLMAHDFCTDEVEFEATGKHIWNCLEIQESDICLDQLRRSDVYSDGLKFAWGIYQKTGGQ
jgi:hypothetical protein